MGTIIIAAVLTAVLVLAIRSAIKRGTSGCCGSTDDVSCRKIKVEDKDLRNYPYEAILYVDGMTCGHCAARVENALNAIGGIWTAVDVNRKIADVHMKTKVDEEVLRKAINDLGMYTIMHIDWIKQ